MRYTKTTMYFATGGASTTATEEKACDLLGGFTLTKAKGGWESNGVIVVEDSFTMEFITKYPVPYEIKALAEFVKDTYTQKEVWVTDQEITNTIY